MARHVAKNVVAAGLATKCEIQVAYAIGVAEPVSIFIDTFDTGVVPDKKLVDDCASCSISVPPALSKRSTLKRPIYQATAAYGHFGRTPTGLLPGKKIDMARRCSAAFGANGR